MAQFTSQQHVSSCVFISSAHLIDSAMSNSLATKFYILSILLNCSRGDCSGSWSQLGAQSFCIGIENLTFDESRLFCQELGADLLVLDTMNTYSDLRSILNETSFQQGGAIVDVFLGLYQRPCVEGVDKGCSWLEPYSSKWYWINSDVPITNSSDTYWHILETNLPYVSSHSSMSAMDLNWQHYMVGSDGNAFAVDRFNDKPSNMAKLAPLCARKVSVHTKKVEAKSATSRIVLHAGYECFLLLWFLKLAFY